MRPTDILRYFIYLENMKMISYRTGSLKSLKFMLPHLCVILRMPEGACYCFENQFIIKGFLNYVIRTALNNFREFQVRYFNTLNLILKTKKLTRRPTSILSCPRLLYTFLLSNWDLHINIM